MDEVKYVVVVDRNSGQDQYFYVGDNELMALKTLRGLKCIKKEIVRATVKMRKLYGYEMIEGINVV